MAQVDFLFCGRRGFNVLQKFVEQFGAKVIRTVVSYADNKVLNDPYDETIAYCNQHHINLCDKFNYVPDNTIYRFVIGWQWLLVAEGKTIVLHDSLLPRYRGFSPLVNCLINGDKETGVTAFIADDNYDEGPIIEQHTVALHYPITILQVMELVTPFYLNIVISIFKRLLENVPLIAYKQEEQKATYSLWRDARDYRLDWQSDSLTLSRKIDALGYPYDGATAMLNDDQITILEAKNYSDVTIENREAGKVIFIKDSCPVIVCGKGLLQITKAFSNKDGSSLIPFRKLKSRFS